MGALASHPGSTRPSSSPTTTSWTPRPAQAVAPLDAAAEQITDAIELLEGYRARLDDLRVALASIEADLADMEEGT